MRLGKGKRGGPKLVDRLVLALSSCVMAAAFRCRQAPQTGRGSRHEPSFLGQAFGGSTVNPGGPLHLPNPPNPFVR
jgi:hypothetical protein